MAKIIVLGSSAEFPLPRTKSNKFEDYLDIEKYRFSFDLHDDPVCQSAKKGGKNRRTRACLALILEGKVILFDAGPDIRCQLKRYGLRPDVVFVTHAHPDADYGLRYLKNINPVRDGSEVHQASYYGVKVYSEKLGNIRPNSSIEIFGVRIFAFRATHSRIAPFLGYKVFLPAKNSPVFKNFVYLTDMASLSGIAKLVKDCDILFADGSILKRNLSGHLAILEQLKFYKRWQLKRVIFTHIGHRTLPHEELSKFLKARYKKAEVAYDGMTIKL